MIQKFLMEQLKPLTPDEVLWTYDFMPRNNNVATVFYEGGGEPGQYDVPLRYPRYMVYLSSTNWEYVESLAYMVFNELSAIQNKNVTVEFYGLNGEVVFTKEYLIQSISPAGEPNPLGTVEDIRSYSINFDVTLIENKEEN